MVLRGVLEDELFMLSSDSNIEAGNRSGKCIRYSKGHIMLPARKA